ncbi:reverse transcriptase domain-containing protein [Tanacetum coccineum]
MPSRMTSRSAGRATATPRGGRAGGRTDRGGGRTKGQTGDLGNSRIDEQAQLDNQCNNQGNNRNQNGDAINDNIQGDVRNIIIHARSREAAVGMTWEDFKTLTKEEFCPINKMHKLETEFWNYAMVGAGHAAYSDRFLELARLVPHLVTPENKMIERYIFRLAPQIWGMVAATKPRNPERRRNGGEPSRDRDVRDDNKRTRTGNAFSTTANPVRREYTGAAPKYASCNLHHSPETPCQACFNCNRLGHMARDCRVDPRMVNPVNARNPTAAHGACFECGGTDHFKAACPRLNQAQRPGGNRPNQAMANNGG